MILNNCNIQLEFKAGCPVSVECYQRIVKCLSESLRYDYSVSHGHEDGKDLIILDVEATNSAVMSPLLNFISHYEKKWLDGGL